MLLSISSINFAINHILKYYDSDFFIKPFEFEAIKAFRNEVIKYLTSKEVENFSVEPPKTFTVHKPKGGYRVVHQLDPLDSIIYTALTREVAEEIETARCNISDSTVCSYRININNSNFFEDGNGYEDFNSKSDSLAKKYKHVLVTDIVDFYNQIYLHRLRNSIEFADASLEEKSRVIENFLMKLNNKNSKGVPVGPSASIIMAEALLLDIDQFLTDKGFAYVRYVDDFRVFADHKIDLEWLLHDITDYIYENHRLTLSSSKTEIIDTTTFHTNYLFDADAIEKQRIHTELEKVQSVHYEPSYFPEFVPEVNEKISNEEMLKINAEVLKKLMDDITRKDTLDLGLARHILRRSSKLRSRAILKQLLTNFDFFVPVLRDICLYLDKVTTKSMIEKNISLFENIVTGSNVISFPYVKYWMKYYFVSYPYFMNSKIIKKYVLNEENYLSGAIYAKNSKNIAWIRKYKNKLNSLNTWDRRAIMYSLRISATSGQ